MTRVTSETVKLDRLDRQLLHALQYDGRASFRVLSDLLDASEQTIARRYRRLREAGIVRVVVLSAPTGGQYWIVRMQVVPGAGGSEVACVCRPRTVGQRDALLLDRLPETELVTSLVSHATLTQFAGDRTEREWQGFDDPLTADQYATLERSRQLPVVVAAADVEPPGPQDAELMAALAADGRAGYAALGDAIGSTAGRVRRRVEALLSTGAAYVDVDLSIEALGFTTVASIWMTVAPARLDEVGRRVAGLPETAYVAAVSGPANLMASVVTRDTNGLYRYVTEKLGGLQGVERAEVAPVFRRVKQAGSIVTGTRLPLPGE